MLFNLFNKAKPFLELRVADFIFLSRNASRSREYELVIGVYSSEATLAHSINMLGKHRVAVWTSPNKDAVAAAVAHPPIAQNFLIPLSALSALEAVHVSYLINVLWLEEGEYDSTGAPLAEMGRLAMQVAGITWAKSRVYQGNQLVRPTKTESRSRHCEPGTVWKIIPQLESEENEDELA